MARSTSRMSPLERLHSATASSTQPSGGSSFTNRWHSFRLTWCIVAGWLARSLRSRIPSSMSCPPSNRTPSTSFSPRSCAQSWNSKSPPCCGRSMLQPVKMRATSITSCCVQPPLGERGADDGQVGEFAREAPAALGDRARRILVGHGVGPRSQFALAPLPLRCGVHGSEVAAVVPEDVEPTLSLRQTVVVDPIGRELAVDPAHHPLRGHAWYVAGSGPVRQAVQGVERRVLRGEGGARHDGL